MQRVNPTCSEAEWRDALAGGGVDLVIPRRAEHTLRFVVPARHTLAWQFRVKELQLDIGFALRR